jgi:hypothetical protein
LSYSQSTKTTKENYYMKKFHFNQSIQAFLVFRLIAYRP